MPSPRLKTELAMLGEYMVDGKDIRKDEVLLKHADLGGGIHARISGKGILVTEDNVWSHSAEEEVGKVFVRVLEDGMRL